MHYYRDKAWFKLADRLERMEARIKELDDIVQSLYSVQKEKAETPIKESRPNCHCCPGQNYCDFDYI